MCKKPTSLRAEVAAWMRNNRANYMEFGTGKPEYRQLVEGAATVFGPRWLDDPKHWVWEEAVLAFEGLPE